MVVDHFAGMDELGEVQHETPEYLHRPRKAHFVVTRTGLTVPIERFAASLSATPTVLPEALPWLTGKVSALCQLGETPVLVGHDYGNPPK